MAFDGGLSTKLTVGQHVARIRARAKSETQKGQWFERLVCHFLKHDPQYQVEDIWRWAEWPDRVKLTGLDARDNGIDLVAKVPEGFVAIQCKCYDESRTLAKGDLNSFLAESSREAFALRWLVASCHWNDGASRAIEGLMPEAKLIDLRKYYDSWVPGIGGRQAKHESKPLQKKAIDGALDGLVKQGGSRGTLVMACGTGKTFTALKIAEAIAPANGAVLFAAPSIALVSQARAEWLTHCTKPQSPIVVCSDSSAGGRSGSKEIGTEELVCRVVTSVDEIAKHLRKRTDGIKTVFCTYQSLDKVIAAQALRNVPRFDLAVADEAHWTTGQIDHAAARTVDYQAFHDDGRLKAAKRLYMTATPRIYSEKSIAAAKRSAEKKGIHVDYTDMRTTMKDMDNSDVYGPLLHQIKFAEAVRAGELADYRVIVLGMRDSDVTPALRAALNKDDVPRKVSEQELARMLGAMLALNGVLEGGDDEGDTEVKRRSIGFASSITRSKWFAELATENVALKNIIGRKIGRGNGKHGRADLEAVHLDGSHRAVVRNEKRQWLNEAGGKNNARMIVNCKVFGEGVDVPALDAVVFLDPKQSPIEIVQAIGRVMRRAKDKKRGYVIVPVVQPDTDDDIVDALAKRKDDWRHVGSVLRALQTHDERLAANPARFVRVVESTGTGTPKSQDKDVSHETGDLFDLRSVEGELVAKLVARSGLGEAGKLTAETIESAVLAAARRIQDNHALIAVQRKALDLYGTTDEEVAVTAALLLCNACLLHRRLRDENVRLQEELPSLVEVGRNAEPIAVLAEAWDGILKRDYEPVFRPALSVLEHDPGTGYEDIGPAVRDLCTRVAKIADSVTELGFDHAGPLYHHVLSHAVSTGAYYTSNIAALMLAGLALRPDMIDWADANAVAKLRVLDPACGTGTILMAALKTIKSHMRDSNPNVDLAAAHKALVENCIIGLDIEYQATQLAASNLTLGAPTVDYECMNIVTLAHGPTDSGDIKLGSLDLLAQAFSGRQGDMLGHMKQAEISNPSVREQRLPELRDMPVVLMNPPFTNNTKRGEKYGSEVKRRMQAQEKSVSALVKGADAVAADVIDSNSVRTFFTPLADVLLDKQTGVLGKVLPTTACTSTSGLKERIFLASKFHIEFIVTSHDPRKPNMSMNTGIHESLLVCRRLEPKEGRRATTFLSVLEMPETAAEVEDWLKSAKASRPHFRHRIFKWPAKKIQNGDWTPCQWADAALANEAVELDDFDGMITLGGGGAYRSRGTKNQRRVHQPIAQVGPAGRRLSDGLHNPLE